MKILIIPQLFLHIIPPTLSRFKAQKHPLYFANYLSQPTSTLPIYYPFHLSW